ncbi:TonB-dependent receptor [Acetobacter conturbans]|uniref:TonB-dependent receptor plug domain-containing protein n=1 Tax=Acetobacter conturbans TaxID=1737472 RepID=A0ABX0K4V9_9PROT|nr:TonB-dependent receptor [Acetobacter conturbans]NHN88464.1 TonB-dependent receptor plug domain-containing protein [Acetobacter conturbans]
MPILFRYRNHILLCTSALALSAVVSSRNSVAATPKTAHASDHAGRGNAPLGPMRKHALAKGSENITVSRSRNVFGQTARQHEGVSVTHIDSSTLARHQVTDVKGLMNLAPNLTVQPQGTGSSVNFTLRGVGLNDFTANNTPSVMTYVDGVALPIGYMAGAAMFDMAGVDINTGPSGFTHGQTVTAGEINVKTADPTKTFHYGASEDIASYNRSITNVYVSGPIASNLQYRIAGFTQQGGGFQKNINTGQTLGNADKGGLRGKLAWQPDDKTNIVFSGNWMQDNSQAMGAYNIQDLSRNTPAYTNNLDTGWGFRPAFLKLTGNAKATKPSYNNTFWGGGINFTRNLGFADLTTISAFQQMYVHNLMDLDGTRYAIYDDDVNTDANMFSQEVRLSSRPEQKRIEWAVGMYYDRTDMHSTFFNDFTQSGSRPYVQRTSYNQDQQAFSQYGHLRFEVTKKLHLIGGITHESDDRTLSNMETLRYNTPLYTTPFDAHYGRHGALTNQFSGMGGIEYQALKNLMFYGSIRKGFKPGGFTANNTVIESQLTPTKPESLLAYEVGFKSDYLNHKLRINGDAFWYDYHDQQVVGLAFVPDYGVVGQYLNIPKSRIWGLEMEIDANPIPGLLLHQHIGYERGNYKDYNALDSTAMTVAYMKTGVLSPYYRSYDNVDMGIPKLTLQGSASYKARLGREWTLTPYIDYSYRGAQQNVPGNTLYRMRAYFLMDMGLTFAPKSNKWSISAYANNILDRHYDITRETGLNGIFGVPGAPRMVGGRFRVDM